MHRAIGVTAHGIIDYASVILIALGPAIAGFGGKQAVFCYILAAVHLALTLLTRFPLGVVKIVSLQAHGAIELLVGVLLVVLPWIAGFAAGVRSRNFFIALGLLLILIWAMTDYRGLRDRAAVTAS